MNMMGIIRNIDTIGRIVIPKEMRDNLNINGGDPVEIIAMENQVIIKKHESRCKFCGTEHELIEHNDYYICNKCLGQIYKKRLKDI